MFDSGKGMTHVVATWHMGRDWELALFKCDDLLGSVLFFYFEFPLIDFVWHGLGLVLFFLLFFLSFACYYRLHFEICF